MTLKERDGDDKLQLLAIQQKHLAELPVDRGVDKIVPSDKNNYQQLPQQLQQQFCCISGFQWQRQ
jgi:hypothetical protein